MGANDIFGLKSIRADSTNVTRLGDEMIAAYGGIASVPLRQVADVVPSWSDGQIVRRNGIPTVTIMAEVDRGINAMQKIVDVQEAMQHVSLAPDVTLAYGGDLENSQETMSQVIGALVVAAVMIYLILLSHFRDVKLSTLVGLSMLLCLLGAALGLKLEQQSIHQSEENLRLYQDYYRAGTSTMSDLLDAQQTYQQAHDSYVATYADYQIKITEYMIATGIY